MGINIREICPNCISLTEVTEDRIILRENESFLMERVVLYCRNCHQELADTVTLKFKPRTG